MWSLSWFWWSRHSLVDPTAPTILRPGFKSQAKYLHSFSICNWIAMWKGWKWAKRARERAIFLAFVAFYRLLGIVCYRKTSYNLSKWKIVWMSHFCRKKFTRTWGDIWFGQIGASTARICPLPQSWRPANSLLHFNNPEMLLLHQSCTISNPIINLTVHINFGSAFGNF